jgi:hypothetical protein
MNIKITAENIAALAKQWAMHAGEPIEIENIQGTLYAFCSELGSLRLLKVYRDSDGAEQGFSEPRGCHFFRLEINL